MRSVYAIAFAFGACLALSQAACPSTCSGHGRCGADDKCTCFHGYSGPDCSQRLCKEGLSWAAGNSNDPHAYAECSNNGLCNRATGECECFNNFEGAACERNRCPNACSGNGVCEYTEELSDYDSDRWDYHRVRACRCDAGFGGVDCSMRICPSGDDPLTVETSVNEVLKRQSWKFRVFYDYSNDADGNYGFGPVTKGEYAVLVTDLEGNTHTTRAINAVTSSDDGDKQLQRALLALPNINSLHYNSTYIEDSTLAGAFSGYFDISITLDNDPFRVARVDLLLQPICPEAGCFPLRNIEFANAAGVPVKITGVDLTTTEPSARHESATCSNRGHCNHATGKCDCFEGHHGLACEKQTILV